MEVVEALKEAELSEIKLIPVPTKGILKEALIKILTGMPNDPMTEKYAGAFIRFLALPVAVQNELDWIKMEETLSRNKRILVSRLSNRAWGMIAVLAIPALGFFGSWVNTLFT
jgi:hypothetical protein